MNCGRNQVAPKYSNYMTPFPLRYSEEYTVIGPDLSTEQYLRLLITGLLHLNVNGFT